MSPAKGNADPESRRSLIRGYFATNRGEHRAKDIAAAIGDGTQPVANECGRLVRQGVLQRILVPTEGRVTPVVMFRLPPKTKRTRKAAK